MAASSLSVIPRSLKVEQLKRLSFLCGLPVTGRRDQLIARLTAAATSSTPPPLTPKSRAGPVILSIDLGIRNLAFSLLSPVSTSASVSPKPKTRSKQAASTSQSLSIASLATSPPTITLHAWKRLSLLESLSSPPAQESDEATIEADTSKSEFAPAALAKTTNAFIQNTILQFNPLPTHILIERQRWRSGGGAAVLEWTVRVNTLEAMLHASLQTLREVGVWKGEVTSIRPELVGQLFLDAATSGTAPETELEEDEVAVPTTTTKSRRKRATGGRKTSAESKKLKIELLSRWLSQGDLVVQPGNVEAGRMLDAYRVATSGIRRRSRRVAGGDVAAEKPLTLDRKLDDLTDSLMQGMAWLRWQENMALLRAPGGVEQLLLRVG